MIIYKRLVLGIALTLLYAVRLHAQSIQITSTQLIFGPTTEIQTDSLSLTIRNITGEVISVNSLLMAPVYGSMPFSCRDSILTIQGFDSTTLWVRFKPVHNIMNNAELILRVCSQGNCYTDFKRVDLRGQGRYSLSYYNSTENLSEQALKNALKTRISNPFSQQTYNDARDFMFMTLDNKAVNGQGASLNTLTCVYTGRTISGYSSRTQAQNSPNNFNTEHTWPQSLFNEALPMRSDLFHLFPTDIAANGSRANYPFGIPTMPFQSVSINQPSELGSNNVYRPRVEQRGVVARAMFYFVIRYQNYSNFLTGQEATLRQWHYQYQPDSVERKRCQDISTYQSNRNPFIDYPQFLDRITSVSAANSVAVSQLDIQTPGNIHFYKVSTDSVYEIFYPIVNTGNAPVTLSNFLLSNPNLSFFSGNTSIQLNPGEAHLVGIRYTVPSTGPIISTEQFSFSRTGVGTPITITIQASLALGLPSYRSIFSPLISPNPTQGMVHIEGLDIEKSASYTVYDTHGILREKGILPSSSSEITLDFRHLSNGMYHILFETSEGQSYRRRFLKY